MGISRRDYEAQCLLTRTDHAWMIRSTVAPAPAGPYVPYVRLNGHGSWEWIGDYFQASHWPTAEEALGVARALGLGKLCEAKDMIVALMTWGRLDLDLADQGVFPSLPVLPAVSIAQGASPHA